MAASKIYDLQNEYKQYLKKMRINEDSAKTYSERYLPSLEDWFRSSSQPFTLIEKDFLDIIPFLLSLGFFEDCTRVLLRLYLEISINAADKTFKNWKSAFNKYCSFIQANYLNKSKRCKYNGTKTLMADYNLIKDELNNYIVYYYIEHGNIIKANKLKLSIKNKKNQYTPKYNLWRIFDNRLRSQNRTSGDKTWLSLKLISRVNSDTLKSYVDNINSSTRIYYINNGVIQSLKCSEIRCVSLKRDATNPLYQMYVTTKKYDTFPVYTSVSKEGANKKPMIISGIDKVVIDHVMPIDQSLRNVSTPNLDICSNTLKATKITLQGNGLKNISDDLVVNETLKKLSSNPTFNNSALQNEMDNLLNDSWYRLMDSKENSLKSNNLEFREFCHNKSNHHIGVIMEVSDPIGNQCIVYRDLTTGNDYVQVDKTLFTNYRFRNVDLTSFKSKGWKVL